jgi:RNA polymerase sigma-70 factor, ECF subfamily
MEACIPALRRYAGALLRDRQEVDDLVHDCLVRALEQLHTRRQDGDLRAWLFAIMHNLFISRTRRNRLRDAARPLDQVGEEMLGLRPSQELHIETRDLLRAVGTLPEEQRSVLLLVTVEDLSYAEVASVLGIPLGTVMSRLARARERLARIVDTGESPPALRRVK